MSNVNLNLDVSLLEDLRLFLESQSSKRYQVLWLEFIINELPTRKELARRGIFRSVQLDICPFCISLYETVHHLFFHCQVMAQVGSLIAKWLGLKKLVDAGSIQSYLQ